MVLLVVVVVQSVEVRRCMVDNRLEWTHHPCQPLVLVLLPIHTRSMAAATAMMGHSVLGPRAPLYGRHLNRTQTERMRRMRSFKHRQRRLLLHLSEQLVVAPPWMVSSLSRPRCPVPPLSRRSLPPDPRWGRLTLGRWARHRSNLEPLATIHPHLYHPHHELDVPL